jgi:hypothetical protein
MYSQSYLIINNNAYWGRTASKTPLPSAKGGVIGNVVPLTIMYK